MHRADPCTGEHRNRALNAHGHIDCNAVPFANAKGLERASHALNLRQQLGIGNPARIFGRIIRLKDKRDRVALPRGNMAVNGVVAKVQNTVFIPFDRHGVERPIAHFRWRREPIDPLGLLRPKRIGRADALRIHKVIVRRAALRVTGSRLGNWKPVLMLTHLLSPVTLLILVACLSGVGPVIQG